MRQEEHFIVMYYLVDKIYIQLTRYFLWKGVSVVQIRLRHCQ